MTQRVVTVGALLFVLLGVPRQSHAGILDFIWEMSGPQLVGFGVGCLYAPKAATHEQCKVGSAFVPGAQAMNVPGAERFFLALGASIFGSTGHDSPTQRYEAGDVWMLALEPGVAFRSYSPIPEVQVHHGIGLSYNRVFGRDLEAFDKWAITVTPIDVTLKRVSVGIKLRLYPDGFTDDEFRPGPKISLNRPFEATVGFTVSYILQKP
jgi:hypothetical protein